MRKRSKLEPSGELQAVFFEAFKRSNDVIFYCDKDGFIKDVNEAFCRHYGYTRDEAIGQSPKILRSRHSTPELYGRMWSSILDPDKGYWRGQIINRAKDGREVPLILTITAVRDNAGEIVGYVSNAVDMSEQMALQERVAQSEALAALGEMAAVVAHEIRNPLGSIVMAAKQLASDPSLSPADKETVLAVLRGESQRLNEVLSNFLSYARPRELKVEPTDLSTLVEEVAGMIQSNLDLSHGIDFAVRIERRLPPVSIDPHQIRQVAWNILLNAVQAMEGRGRLSLETGRHFEFAFFRVTDTGPGLNAEAIPLLFKPFHTTKRQGTGLGLAIAQRIVKAHGGRIDVDSSLGRGTAFTVFLPSPENT